MAESGVTVALISFGSSFFSAFIVLLGDRYMGRLQKEAVTESARIGAGATIAGADRQAQATVASSQWQSRKAEADEYRVRISDLKKFQESLYSVRDQIDPLIDGTLPAAWPPIVRRIPLHVPRWIPSSSDLSVQILADRMRRGASRIDLEVPLEVAQTEGTVSPFLREVAEVLKSEIDQMIALAEEGISALEGWISDTVRPER
ncbi:hypothetical protein [Streptomyces sp. MST-110588]|uniref:hypothetical protein n=1 Tax=Streptomyces sp. MST-110588 TaxID=2833628 RepID=UPI001F5D1FA7|nr:hypothetical protein [Streptomyces sp. MST-110588]UNO43392.1 hypothetical protein KGS77_32825 [Streptomyces sp. MST-110588]